MTTYTLNEALELLERHADALAVHNDKTSLLSALVAAADARHVQARAEYDRLLADETADVADLNDALRAVRRTRLVLDEFSKRLHAADDHQLVARETFVRKAAEMAAI